MKLNEESDADSGPISARLSSGVPVDLSLAFQLRLHRDVESVRYLISAYGADTQRKGPPIVFHRFMVHCILCEMIVRTWYGRW